jgi:hypothetical protein
MYGLFNVASVPIVIYSCKKRFESAFSFFHKEVDGGGGNG